MRNYFSSVFILLTVITLLTAQCSPVRYHGPKLSYFDGKIFKNSGPINEKGFSDFLSWVLFETKTKWPEQLQNTPYPPPSADVSEYEMQVTFINHASFLIQIGGLNILTDPQYSERASPFTWAGPKRVRLPGVAFEDLPKIDVVLISHDHYDHLDIMTLEKLKVRDDPLILSGLGVDDILQKESTILSTTSLPWWQAHKSGEVNFHFVPAQHFSSRWINDRFASLWGGFVINYRNTQIFFAGDTGYSNHFKQIQNKFPKTDLALIPIGAYEPRWFMKDMHVNPDEAVLAHLDLKAKQSIGMHFGTFQLTNEGIDEPAKALLIALKKYRVKSSDFLVPDFGQSWRWVLN
ncbi:MAG: MBL fold metallo-hydrolase [Oligoflexales bacterium]|nr:MBL fold metallo-hydrolase [Oligoflexales bacterium]